MKPANHTEVSTDSLQMAPMDYTSDPRRTLYSNLVYVRHPQPDKTLASFTYQAINLLTFC